MNRSLESNIINENPQSNAVYFGIAAILGGASLGVIALIAIFSPDNLSVAPWIVGGLSMMGIALGYFSSNSRK
jgi:peptidoglycan/LPS O-acetylase OafA/YrhL